ncbi:MAG: cation diffusion facilitator family transporter [Desulfobulbaceae bacterium]|nr:cation diffusion facilitator family transporter [Desulfobulbaceae bacterium]HIJ79400.1 cation transporter [Deltaproteobacteria bacterium]
MANVKYKACDNCFQAVGKVNIVGNIFMIVLKGFLGVVGGSKGLIADAIHSCADLLATIVMIIGIKISGQEKNERYPYGYGKAEHIVAIVICLFLYVIAAYILYDGVMTIVEGRMVIPCTVAVWGAVFSILINELMFRQALCAGTKANSPSMVAKAWESRTDVYSSIAVVFGVIGAKMGFHFMDPLAAVVVGLMIFRMCFEMTQEAALALLDKAPEEASRVALLDRFNTLIEDIAVEIRDVKVRELGAILDFVVEVKVPDCITVQEGEKIKQLIAERVAGQQERESVLTVRLYPFENQAAVPA